MNVGELYSTLAGMLWRGEISHDRIVVRADNRGGFEDVECARLGTVLAAYGNKIDVLVIGDEI